VPDETIHMLRALGGAQAIADFIDSPDAVTARKFAAVLGMIRTPNRRVTLQSPDTLKAADLHRLSFDERCYLRHLLDGTIANGDIDELMPLFVAAKRNGTLPKFDKPRRCVTGWKIAPGVNLPVTGKQCARPECPCGNVLITHENMWRLRYFVIRKQRATLRSECSVYYGDPFAVPNALDFLPPKP
jgi:hypothetical protein